MSVRVQAATRQQTAMTEKNRVGEEEEEEEESRRHRGEETDGAEGERRVIGFVWRKFVSRSLNSL